jgi:CheY-like chemotaxis protein
MPSTGLRVLIVDDNRDAGESLAKVIELMGYKAEFMTDPDEVLDRVVDAHPSIVFLDLGMPKVDGLEVCRRLRRRFGFDTLCVVALTGHGSPEDRSKTRRAGFDAHLVKPAEPDLIRSTIEELCKPKGWDRQ